MLVKVKRVKDKPRIHYVSNEMFKKEFPREQDEFVIDEQELPLIIRDANMELVGYVGGDVGGDETITPAKNSG